MARPRVTVYNEVSVDGRVTGFASDPGRYYALGFRWPLDAVLMGSVTARAFGGPESDDDYAGSGPQPDPVAVPPGFEELVTGSPRPLLVVVDSAGVIRNWRQSRAQPWYSGQVCLVSASTPQAHLDHLARRGVHVVLAGDERVDLSRALEVLHETHGVRRVRTDGGGALTGALVAAGLVDELVLLVTPTVAGDRDTVPLVRPPHGLDVGTALSLEEVERLDDDHVLLRYTVPGR